MLGRIPCRIFSLLALVLLSGQVAVAQDEGVSLRMAPLRMFDPFGPGVDFGLEIPLHPRHSLLLDLGYISSWGGRWVYADPRQGGRLRATWRMYEADAPVSGDRKFLGVELNGLGWTSERVVGVCKAGCSYFEDLAYTYQAMHFALLGRFGKSYKLGDRFRIELAPGAGFQFFQRRAPALAGIPRSQIRYPETRLFRLELDQWLFSPVVSLGFTISFAPAGKGMNLD